MELPKLPFSIKLGGMFFITLYISLFFSVIYWKLFNKSFVDSFYNAVSIQTIGGNQLIPRTNSEKAAVTVQSFVAFMILNGLIVVSIAHQNSH